MSRHVIGDSDVELVVGWDPPLETFFVQIREPGSDIPYQMMGGDPRQLYDLEDLVTALPWKYRRLLTPGLEVELERDRDEGR